MKTFNIQKTFVFGVVAVAVVAIATGAVVKLQSISADSLNKYANMKTPAADNCNIAGTTVEPSELSAGEKTSFPENSKAYTVHTTQDKNFRLIVGVREENRIGKGGIVSFTVGIGNLNNFVYTEKAGRIYLAFPNNQKLDFRYDSPNLAVGQYWVKSLKWSMTDYSVPVKMELRNGSNQHFVGCVANAINVEEALGLVDNTADDTETAIDDDSATATSTGTSTNIVNGSIRGCYYNSSDFTAYAGARSDKQIKFNWGTKIPANGVEADTFSVRWVGYVTPKYSQDYTFSTVSDDGIRVYVDDKKVIDKWKDGNNSASGTIALKKNKRTKLKVEYYENAGNARAELYWKSKDQAQEAIPSSALSRSSAYKCAGSSNGTATPTETTTSDNDEDTATVTIPSGYEAGLIGQYYSDKTLSNLVKEKVERRLQFNWKESGPPYDPIANDNFSVRWSGKIIPKYSEEYQFTAVANDGVKVWVNNKLIIDAWKDGDNKKSGKIKLQADKLYNFKVEYYEGTGNANVKVVWKSDSQELQTIPNSSLAHVVEAKCLAEGQTLPTNSNLLCCESLSLIQPISSNVTSQGICTAKCGNNVWDKETESAYNCPQDVDDVQIESLTLQLDNGFNAISLPADKKPVLTQALKDAGMTMFEFNRAVEKNWNREVDTLYHSIGYYIMNPGSDQTITLPLASTTSETDKIYMKKGWNLLANSENSDKKLTDMSYLINGTSTKISDLFQGEESKKRAYVRMYIIKDTHAETAENAFTEITVTSENVSTVAIPANKLFWIYLWE